MVDIQKSTVYLVRDSATRRIETMFALLILEASVAAFPNRAGLLSKRSNPLEAGSILGGAWPPFWELGRTARFSWTGPAL